MTRQLKMGSIRTAIHSRGFTIVELLIVIVVIGILAALVLNSFSGAQAKSRDAKRQDDLSAIRKALETFHIINGKYPDNGGLYTPGTAFACAGTIVACAPNLSPTYITFGANGNGVQDPMNSGSFQYWYVPGYRKNSNTTWTYDQSDNYILGAKLETSTGPQFSGWTSTDLNYVTGSTN